MSKNGTNGHRPGITLSRLAADRKTVDVAFGEEIISVTYRPRWFTALTESRFREASEQERHAKAAIEMFIDFVSEWNVTDDNGDVIPLTAEGLSPVPTVILTDIFAKVMDDLRPNRTSG